MGNIVISGGDSAVAPIRGPRLGAPDSSVAQRFSRLQLVAAGLTRATSADEVLEALLAQGLSAVGASGATLVVRDGPDLVVVAATGFRPAAVAAFARFPASADLPLAVAYRTREPVWVSSQAERAARFPILADADTGAKATASIPLVVEDEVVGVLGLAFIFDRELGVEEREFLVSLADVCAHALYRLPPRPVPVPMTASAAGPPDLVTLGLLEQELALFQRAAPDTGARAPHAGQADQDGASPADVDVAAYGLLAWIEQGGACRVTDLARTLNLGKPTLSRQVAALEIAGLVRRVGDSQDGRSRLISLSKAGQRVLQDMRRVRVEQLSRRLSDWTADDVGRLSLFLRRLNRPREHAGPPSRV